MELKEQLHAARLSPKSFQLTIPLPLREEFKIKDREVMGFYKDDKGRLVIMVANPNPMPPPNSK